MKGLRLNTVNSHIALRCGKNNPETKPKASITKTIKLKGEKYGGK